MFFRLLLGPPQPFDGFCEHIEQHPDTPKTGNPPFSLEGASLLEKVRLSHDFVFTCLGTSAAV